MVLLMLQCITLFLLPVLNKVQGTFNFFLGCFSKSKKRENPATYLARMMRK